MKIIVGDEVIDNVEQFIIVTKEENDPDGISVKCQATANTMLNIVDSLVNQIRKMSNDNPMVAILLAAKLHKMGDEIIGTMGTVNQERCETPDKNLC